jgi:3-phosphoshikimate 1-carboxyvinyltransferase
MVTVHGVGVEGLKEPDGVLDVGNAGTLIRIGAGLLAACPFFTVVTGDESILQRPMGRIVDPLMRMGATIAGRAGNTLAPLAICGGGLQGMTHVSKTASAQVKSAVLLAGLLADKGETVVEEPARSRDHTERMLRYLGADLAVEGLKVRIRPQKRLTARPVVVPGDISSAAFVLAAALLKTDSEVTIRSVGYNPSRAGIVQVLREMGGRIEVRDPREVNGEPVADLQILPSTLHGIDLRGSVIANIIDEIPIISVLATQAKGRTIIADAGELRVKESDRIRTMVEGLRRLGAHVEERPEGMVIDGPVRLQGGEVESFGDHRVAMSLAIAGLVAEGSVIIKDTACVRTSFPGFTRTLQNLAGQSAIREVELP